MSNFKFSEQLFLGKAELERFKKFIQSDGYEAENRFNTESFGVIYNKFLDPNFNFFKVDGLPGNNGVYIKPGFAYNKDGDLLVSNGVTVIMSQSENWFWVLVKHKTIPLEKGTVTIGGSAGGTMTGVGTEFTKLLRGQPDFPSKIRFINSANYGNTEYEVVRVIDDVTAEVQGSFQTQEATLQYVVVGTFTPGYYVPTADKQPFEYDDFEYQLIQEATPNVPPSVVEGSEFLIARVRVSGISGTVVQDKRKDCLYKSRAERFFEELPNKPNPLIGIEKITQVDIRGQLHHIVRMGWGFNIGLETRNINLNKVLIKEGSGGAYKATTAFSDGDFDGFRYYYEDGSYSRIVTSVKNGNDIELQLDVLQSDKTGFMICPNAEEVEFRLGYYDNGDGKYMNKLFHFPSFTREADLLITQSELVAANKKVTVKHRFRSNYRLTQETDINFSNYPVTTIGLITDKDIVLSQASAPPPSGLAWRGINQFCEIRDIDPNIYYKISLRNPVGPTTEFFPNSDHPISSQITNKSDLYIEFYSDAGRTIPAVVNFPSLLLIWKETNTQTHTVYDVPTIGSSTDYHSVSEFVQATAVAAIGVTEVFVQQVTTHETDRDHPTNDPLVYRTVDDMAFTQVEFPNTLLFEGNTGRKGFNNLEEYDTVTLLPTGNTKPNLISDPDYIDLANDFTSCPVNIPSFGSSYGYGLNQKKLVATAVSKTETLPIIADTEAGGYGYIRPQFLQDEAVTLTVRTKTLDIGNTTGSVWVRVTWKDIGATSTTSTQVQIPNDVETVLPQVFRNIQFINISNF